MDYTQGTMGRVFILRFQHGEDVLKELETFVLRERIHTAGMLFVGALEQGTVVAGPKRPVIPPDPWAQTLKDGWEWLGGGTVFDDGQGGSKLHVHGAWGRGRKTLAGCLRQTSRVFLMVEAMVWEIVGAQADKALDPASGVSMLRILGPGAAPAQHRKSAGRHRNTKIARGR